MTENHRVAIVTGAAGGIGRAMTRALLAAGIQVAGVDRDREPLEALAASARQQGKAAELLTIAADLTDDSAVDAITKATRVKFGRIDILVNNAGIGPGAIRPDSWQRPLKFWEITPDQWRRFVAVHTTATTRDEQWTVCQDMIHGGSKGLRAHFTRATISTCRLPQREQTSRSRQSRTGRFGAVPSSHLGGVGFDWIGLDVMLGSGLL